MNNDMIGVSVDRIKAVRSHATYLLQSGRLGEASWWGKIAHQRYLDLTDEGFSANWQHSWVPRGPSDIRKLYMSICNVHALLAGAEGTLRRRRVLRARLRCEHVMRAFDTVTETLEPGYGMLSDDESKS